LKKNSYPRPILKWAGGKSQLLEKFRCYYPGALIKGEIDHYIEPFVGGGAVFFDIYKHFPVKSAQLFDFNRELILVYRVVQTRVEALIDSLQKIEKKYHSRNQEERKAFFYNTRQSFNNDLPGMNFKRFSKKWIKRATQVIFMNRTCYNGLFRVNSTGKFNVPFGDYKNPTICDTDNLMSVSKALQIAEIGQMDFKNLSLKIPEKTFVYFDPPYRPLKKSSSFTAYSLHVFDDQEQMKLGHLFREINEKSDALLMLSNSDPKNENPEDHFFDELYADFNIHRIKAKRFVNSKGTGRGDINEIVVTNYQLPADLFKNENNIKAG
jgi:DNA adenine methylase